MVLIENLFKRKPRPTPPPQRKKTEICIGSLFSNSLPGIGCLKAANASAARRWVCGGYFSLVGIFGRVEREVLKRVLQDCVCVLLLEKEKEERGCSGIIGRKLCMFFVLQITTRVSSGISR